MRRKISSLAGSWNLSKEEKERVMRSLKRGWEKWKQELESNGQG